MKVFDHLVHLHCNNNKHRDIQTQRHTNDPEKLRPT